MSVAAYRDGRGRLVSLGEELGAGGEGTVFSIRGSPRLCAKIYRPEKAEERGQKLRAMLASPPSWRLNGAIAWPTDLLYADEQKPRFAGFVMPSHHGMVELYRLLIPDERLQIAAFLSARDHCLLAARLAHLVHGIHRAGHCVGDLKPQNVLVAAPTGRPALVDTDSFQIRDRESSRLYASRVVTAEYTAPELFADPEYTPRSPASDAFALAVLIHQILLGGAHPFEAELIAGRGSIERIPGRIRRGLCSLSPGAAAILPAPGALSTAILHPQLQALFVQCFGPGHQSPSERPDAAAWRKALLIASDSMVRCAASRAHLHDRRLTTCPWCERRERTGLDLFPAGQNWQRALARTREPSSAPETRRKRWLRRHVHGRARGRALTFAERQWLFKTGAALGLNRELVTQVVEDAARPSPSGLDRARSLLTMLRRAGAAPRLRDALARWRRRFSPVPGDGSRGSLWSPRRQVVALSTLSLAAVTALATSALVAAKSRVAPAEAPDDRSRCASPPTTAREKPPPLTPARPDVQRARIGNTHGTGAYLRASPSTASAKRALPEGTLVHLTGQKRAAEALVWAHVEVEHTGLGGWVATRYLVQVR